MRCMFLMSVGLIGGSGLDDLIEDGENIGLETPYGIVKIVKGVISGVDVYFISRHGRHHKTPPHKVNYRGNLYALKKLGVDKVIATSAVGSLLDDLPPGSLVLIDQFIDFTKRHLTFYDDVVVHVDVSKPYCKTINRILYESGKNINISVRTGGTYICTEGPRFETPAEINMFRLLGGTVVGMTNVPEVVLAREIALHYSLLAIVTNYAAGMQDRVSHEEVINVMRKVGMNIRRLVYTSIKKIEDMNIEDDCILYQGYASKYIV